MILQCFRSAHPVRAALTVPVRVLFHPGRGHRTPRPRRTRRIHQIAVIEKEVAGATGAVDEGVGHLARILHRLMTQILHHHREDIARVKEELGHT